MDIVLELTDTFIADYAYAYFFPARPAPYDFPHATAANASAQTFTAWTWKPATQFIQVAPSQAAYNTSLPRDHVYRQLVTLFFITWYGHPHALRVGVLVALADPLPRIGSLASSSTSSSQLSPTT